MDLKDLYNKLDSMNEQLSKVRETCASTQGILQETLKDSRFKYEHLQDQVDDVTKQQNQWKGAVVVLSAIFSGISAVVVRILFK